MKSLHIFIKENNELKNIKGISNTTTDDIINYVQYIVNDIIETNELDIEIIDYYVHGSRVYGNPKKDSDIDVVVYYKGNIKEDSLFNIFHDEEYKDELIYDNIEIDLNPIRDEETGSLSEYIKKDKNYKKQ